MKSSFLTQKELARLGLNSYGANVMISRKASLYSPENISIADNVRIDDFVILSGFVDIGSYIHISAYSALYGSHGIKLDDFVTISGRVLIYSVSDDYGGSYLTNPTVPDCYRNVDSGSIHINRFAIIGAGSIILPGVTVGEGVAVGAMSLVKKDLEAWAVYSGVPAMKIRSRNQGLLKKAIKITKER